jgi:periplasmic divalent cation tolerance protein
VSVTGRQAGENNVMTPMLLIYITAKDNTQARTIGKAIVKERLAACANIIPAMNSFYFWEGKLCDDAEAVVIVKTRKALLDRLIKRVKTLHSYAVPCIVALPIVGGNPDFLAWVHEETRGRKPRKRKKKTDDLSTA